jgi:flagellin-like protein
VSRRGVAPVIGVCLLLAVTVVLAALVGAFALGLGGLGENAPEAAITADIKDANYGNKEIVLTHMGGDKLDVRDLTVRIFVDGQPLASQPDVPGTGMSGFYGFPDGPFRQGKNHIWTAGEDASLTIAGTNSPQPSAGSRITVKIYADNEIVATAQAMV